MGFLATRNRRNSAIRSTFQAYRHRRNHEIRTWIACDSARRGTTLVTGNTHDVVAADESPSRVVDGRADITGDSIRGMSGYAISAVDNALWDQKGKLLGRPVYELLGGPQKDKIFCYASNTDISWGTSNSIDISVEAYLAKFYLTSWLGGD